MIRARKKRDDWRSPINNWTYPLFALQFSLRTLLMTMLVVAAFCGGMAVQRQIDKPKAVETRRQVSAGPVDIVWGVHSVDLDDVLSDLAAKTEATNGKDQE